jgi:hypothetical protein
MNRNDLFLRLRALFAWRRVESELDEELRFHIEMQTRKNLAAGMRHDDAARHARIQFGGVAQAQEECRDARRTGFFETLFQDVRYAIRGFRRTPGFAFTVIATVALGLGLNTSLFTAFNAYVLRPLAVRDPYSLYRYTWINRNGDGHMFSWREFQGLCSQNPAFSEIMAVDQLGFARAEGHIMFGQLVTGNYFRMLGIEAALGRTLYPEDAAAPGSAPVVVLSFKTWLNKFAGDPDIVGKKIFIHGYPLEVVGVARGGFTGLSEVPLDFWAPLTMAAQLEPGPSLFAVQQPERLNIIGRLRRELSPRQAAAALTAWAQQTTTGRPAPEKATGTVLRSEATTIPLDPIVIAAFSPIIVAFGVVLLISCANVANMMLARAMARQREIGIRLAIGAARAAHSPTAHRERSPRLARGGGRLRHFLRDHRMGHMVDLRHLAWRICRIHFDSAPAAGHPRFCVHADGGSSLRADVWSGPRRPSHPLERHASRPWRVHDRLPPCPPSKRTGRRAGLGLRPLADLRRRAAARQQPDRKP